MSFNFAHRLLLFCIGMGTFYLAFGQTRQQFQVACASKPICLEIKSSIEDGQDNDKLLAGQVLELASNRFGYGISSSEQTFLPDKVSAQDIDKIAWILYSQIFNEDPTLGVGSVSMRASNVSKILSTGVASFIRDRNLACFDLSLLSWQGQYNFDAIPTKVIEQRAYDVIYGSCSSGMNDGNLVRRRLVEYARQRQVLGKVFGSQYADTQTGQQSRDIQMNINSVLQEFWYNHFNIDSYTNRDDVVGDSSYDSKISNNLHTNFRSMLGAIIKSPGMLRFLNNIGNRYVKANRAASNQNLGRELLELHTFGVGPKSATNNSPYGQMDVEVSSLVLTGHTFVRTRTSGSFAWGYVFSPAIAYPASVYNSKLSAVQQSKVASFERDFWIEKLPADRPLFFTQDRLKYLDTLAPADRLEYMLDLLADSKVTKRNICNKLVKRFFTSQLTPQASNECFDAISSSANMNGLTQLRRAYLAVVKNSYMWTRQNNANMTTNPLETVVRGVRTTGITWENFSQNSLAVAAPLMLRLGNFMVSSVMSMGLNYRLHGSPAGYDEAGASWVSQGFVLNHVNLSFYYTFLDQRLSIKTTERQYTKSTEILGDILSLRSILPSDPRLATQATKVIYSPLRNQATTHGFSQYQAKVIREIASESNPAMLNSMRDSNGRRFPSVVDTILDIGKLTIHSIRK